MFEKQFVMAAVVACWAATAAADIVCADSSYATVQYATAKDRVTISPGLNGETFAQNGITVKVYLKNCNGAPLAGVPRDEVVLFSPALHICTGGNVADAATDLNGAATFTGSIRGGGCANSLSFLAGGITILQKLVPGLMPPASLTPIKTNSPDGIHSPGYVDAGDLAALAGRLGCPGPACPPGSGYSICYDWNEDGFIDAGDGASFALRLGTSCN